MLCKIPPVRCVVKLSESVESCCPCLCLLLRSTRSQQHVTMKSPAVTICLVVVVLACSTGPVHGWWCQGHMLTALIAQRTYVLPWHKQTTCAWYLTGCCQFVSQNEPRSAQEVGSAHHLPCKGLSTEPRLRAIGASGVCGDVDAFGCDPPSFCCLFHVPRPAGLMI